MLTLSINGQPRQFVAPLTVADLVQQLDLLGKRVAIERNGDIVPRSTFAATALAEGDQLEIVVAVGGG
ncbi:sulfur carrier protein ThiS [Amantichitinum ursilacus]|uniref:Sulfur carrier protein ThiS n=1 Tax=Amantichitinum ursilacus TaxID=857265 RepID=A0A0N0XJ81_9NEIS|nr:sulfur carrier protein ThiS [Amantichitinum ursilacus]KPC50855.1 sulfur carrier protein ThiS [Amantichitinum ursilacus]